MLQIHFVGSWHDWRRWINGFEDVVTKRVLLCFRSTPACSPASLGYYWFCGNWPKRCYSSFHSCANLALSSMAEAVTDRSKDCCLDLTPVSPASPVRMWNLGIGKSPFCAWVGFYRYLSLRFHTYGPPRRLQRSQALVFGWPLVATSECLNLRNISCPWKIQSGTDHGLKPPLLPWKLPYWTTKELGLDLRLMACSLEVEWDGFSQTHP